jgi:hypothetical protein
VSISKAARQLKRNAHYTKGFAEGMGIRLRLAPPSVVMTEEDFERLKARIEKFPQPAPRPAPKRDRRPATRKRRVAASA